MAQQRIGSSGRVPLRPAKTRGQVSIAHTLIGDIVSLIGDSLNVPLYLLYLDFFLSLRDKARLPHGFA